MGFDSPWHWLVLIVVVAALFGYKKLPEASRSLGRSLRIFKAELKGMGEDDKAREAAAAAAAAPVVVTPPIVAPAAPVTEVAATPVNAATPVSSEAPTHHPAE